ncbi:MAG: thymidine phosphorylase [Cyanobacteria bacterium]|nr:thymidine phosphorylase [Cyanobacteriota bacterium]
MRAVDIIRAKRDGEALSREAIESFVRGVTDGSWEDYQSAALLMAIVLKGMTADETGWLTDAMARSGDRVILDQIPGIKVGKHSTGGVGDKVSIVLAPLAASCGVVVPKMSGRGLGHTGGTLDKLESIPGFRIALSLEEYKKILGEVGCCLISQTDNIAPADKKLYALRDVTATIESLPLIAASVMSKKLAEGSTALVLDVKCGRGAFMQKPGDARALARALVSIGTAAGLRTEAFITRMDTPLGRAVGNSVEIAECIEVLSGNGPADLSELIVRLASRIVFLGGKAASEQDAAATVRAALTSGAAREKLRQMITWQGGDANVVDDVNRLPSARHSHAVAAPQAGYVASMDALLVGRTAVALGAGRDKKSDPVDLSAGILLRKKPGERVNAGDAIMELRYNDASRLAAALPIAAQAIVVGDTAPADAPLVMGWVHDGGEQMFAATEGTASTDKARERG